jgi:hypothetical protein
VCNLVTEFECKLEFDEKTAERFCTDVYVARSPGILRAQFKPNFIPKSYMNVKSLSSKQSQ